MSSRLTSIQIDNIYKVFITGKYTIKQIAEKFKVSPAAISYQLTKKFKTSNK